MSSQPMLNHTLQAVVATSAILAAELVHVDAPDYFTLIERLGLAVALVLFFVWTGWKREQRMGTRIDKLEKDNTKLADRTATLAEQVNSVLKQDNVVIADAIKVLASRPCWAFASREEFEEMQRRIRESVR